MRRIRVIPTLLLKQRGLVKTIGFKRPTYVGDPINAIRIFNDKDVDELVLLDIMASREGQEPPWELISEVASECFMPFAYGGGIRSVEQAMRVLETGVEKVILNTAAARDPSLVEAIAKVAGTQSVVVSIDVKRRFGGRYRVYTTGGTRKTGRDPVDFAREMAARGAGEILLNSIDRDGSLEGYDTLLIEAVARSVSVPVVACGGASTVEDFAEGVRSGASAVAAGSMFVFQGKHRAVLISFPTEAELKAKLFMHARNTT